MEGNSLNSFENLCKIFEMRIKLDKEKGVKTSLEVLNNYEKYSKKIDSIYNNEFQKELKPLISPAVTLEKEKDRLRRLIKLLEDRLEKRVNLEDSFYETTGKYISGLQVIVSEDELESKKERLSLISRYLDTSEEIDSVTNSISDLKKLLLEEENKREQYEQKNSIMEDDLYSSFMNVINSDEYYKNISVDDINDELDNIRNSVVETKETLDITKDSVGSLITNGLEDDYASYIEEAEKNYYNYKNKEIILKIYKLVTSFEDEFKLICAKREKISELLEEKREISDSLVIDVTNELSSFEEVVMLQIKSLDIEREILDNIINYNSRIEFKEERLAELKEVNNSVEILAIMREYGLIDTYDTDDVEDDSNLALEEIVIPSLEEEPIVENIYNPYRIVDVVDYPRTLNVGLAKLKGESVREKVNKKLNPKTENIVSEVKFEPEEEKTQENVVPVLDLTIEIPSVSEKVKEENVVTSDEVKMDMPVWELPTEVVPKPITFENQEVSPLPVWEAIKPEPIETLVEPDLEINNIDIVGEPQDNNAFWIPVSESKMDSKDLTNLNIPVTNNFNKNSEFVFPTINN